MDRLVERAQRWVADVHPHPRHLERTLDWVLLLHPDAGVALQIAAVTHDIERAFPAPAGEQPPGSDDPGHAAAYNAWHQARCAEVVAAWLAEQDAPDALVTETRELVSAHEDGGWPEADLLQAADSLSFLEVQSELFARFVSEGRLTRRAARDKVQWMYDRIQVADARERGEPLLEQAHARVAAAPDPFPSTR